MRQNRRFTDCSDEAKTRRKKRLFLIQTEDAEIEICDRAYIMHEGEITEELKGEDITVPNIVKLF